MVLVAAGAALVALTLYDVVRTVFDVGVGGGPITGRSTRAAWAVAVRTHQRRTGHRALESVGIAIVLSVLGTWLAMLWAGWVAIAAAEPNAFVHATSGRPATLWERAYVVGGQLFSLSIGDFRADTTGWRLVEVGIVSTGLLVVTLSITYLVPVISAATSRRKLASHIAALGPRTEDIARRARAGGLDDQLTTLTPEIFGLAELHLAYPVLHFFHSSRLETAVAPMIGRLAVGLRDADDGSSTAIEVCRRAIDEVARSLDLRTGKRDEDQLDRLRAVVAQDGWSWDDDVLARETLRAEDGRPGVSRSSKPGPRGGSGGGPDPSRRASRRTRA